LFALSGGRGAKPERAAGAPDPIFSQGVSIVADGRSGAALALADDLTLAWPAAGNIHAQRGTVSFFFRARTPLGSTPFALFRVGGSDGTSWDMTWARIDWNGHGFDAFVTDTGLARTRASFRIDAVPAPSAWTHIAFAWDETIGVRLWIDGKPAARTDRKAVYDAGLFGFGPFQRIVSPYQVQSQYNFRRSGDLDELRIYDHMLEDAQVAALAAAETPSAPAAPARSLADTATRDQWWLRHGWTREAPAYLADPVTRIRKVEFSDTRDLKQRMFRGADGIRETTWPGVYNRSRLAGRTDYFELPDWNVYSTGGRRYTLVLPDERWNRVEITGPAFGKLIAGERDTVNQWVPLALMGVAPDRLIASQRRLLDATYANHMWSNGLSRIRADELHSYEEGINAVAQAMQLSWGDPSAIERAMEVARNYPRLAQTNEAGHSHIISSYFSGTDIVREGVWGWQRPYGFLVAHPGLLLVDYNGAPAVKSVVLPLLDGWLAHGRQEKDGTWSFPAEIEWKTDAVKGSGVASAANMFWAAWAWTRDDKYLRPIMANVSRPNLAGLSQLNADLLAQLPGGPALSSAVATGSVKAGGASNDRNLGGSSDSDFARFVRWQRTGDKAILADLYGAEIESNSQRMHLLTEGHFWSDRVSVPSELLQRARLGGTAHRRNAYYPGNLVRWRFAGAAAEDIAILIPDGDPRRFKVILYNLSGSAAMARMIGDRLAAGTWRMSGGVDADGNDRADTAGTASDITLEMGAGVDLAAPPRQSMVYSFELVRPGDEPATRADIGVSADDLVLRGSKLAITVHGLGARPTPAGVATVSDATGLTVATVRFPALAPPNDLLPKTATVRATVPQGVATSELRVTLRLDGDPKEVSGENNSAGYGKYLAGRPVR
jgi:hypothetical protein